MIRALSLLLTILLASPTWSAELADHYGPGRIDVAETLVSPSGQGWTCVGAGQAQPQARSYERESFNGATTVLRAVKDCPLLIHAQSSQFTLRSLSLDGSATRGKAVGVHVYHRGDHNGAKGDIDRLSFRDFAVGVVIGAVDAKGRSEHGNDNARLSRCQWDRCGVAVRVISAQSMHHRIDDSFWRGGGVFLDVEAGGKVHVDDLDTSCRGTLLRVTGDGTKVGPNNGGFVIQGVTIDGSGDTLTLVEQTHPTATCQVVAKHFDWTTRLMGGKRPTCRATLTGRNARLSLRDHRNLPADTRLTLTEGAECVVESCDLLGNPFDLLSADSNDCRLTVRNCVWERGLGKGRFERVAIDDLEVTR
ncbi:MAG: hypothetical protein AAF805_13915 [Planctomycetota bacterium]